MAEAPGPDSPRKRILDAADRLFYSEGFNGVGMDRLVREARVTRTTMYRQFRSKSDLVEAYLRRRAERERAAFIALTESVDDPRDAVRLIGTTLVDHDLADIWRGCPFINAAAECSPTDHVVRRIAGEHRRWVTAMIARLLADAGHPDADATARVLMMLRTGAVVAASLDGEPDFTAEFLAVCDQLVSTTLPLS